MNSVRARLGNLCDQITLHPSLVRAIRDAEAGTALDEVLTLVQGADTPDPGRLARLLEEIEQACAGMGVVLGVTKRFTPLPELSADADTAEPPTWICPAGRCARIVFDEETGAAGPPHCAALDTQMAALQVL